MPRYFMHLRDGKDEILDPEGIETTPENWNSLALGAARDCMASDIRHGKIDLGYWIDVHDESDEIVHTISFADAVEIVRSPATEG